MELQLNESVSKPTLCLNMIVKNESKIITRLFDSVLPIIDCYCICDTGSTDNTVQVIQEYFSTRNITGIVVTEPFKDFCHNRNFALKSCQGMSDFVLLMDADMILEINAFDKNMLKHIDSCYILQGNENFYYQNLRIVRNNGLYNYVGVTHEYINTPSNNKNSEISKQQLFIRDFGDGGCKNDKYERDIRLLLDGLKEEPTNGRYYFYLANSYYDSGKNEQAIEMYEKRIKIGGWDQEIWYSYYRIGLCYKNLGKVPDAISNWLDGYNCLPERLEGLYEIIQHYRITSKHKLALHFYEMAITILNKQHNRDKYLFLHNDVYTHKLVYEYTIFALYNGIHKINDQIITVLNNCNDTSINNNLLTNMKFYKDVLTPAKLLNVDKKVNIPMNNENIPFHSSSSCLIKKDDGYLLNIRFVNYLITSNGGYTNCDKHIITANKFVELNNNFNIVNEKWFHVEYSDRLYIGIEDVRIFNDVETNELLFIGTGYHKNNTIGIVEGKYDTNMNELVSNEITSSFTQSNCEKNWVYVDYKNSTHLIYKWSPLQICKLDKETNKISIVETKKMPNIFSHVRGSSCGYKYTKFLGSQEDNIVLKMEEIEIWFVVHLVSYEQPRHYYHMTVVFDESMNLLRYSAPFKFEGEPIEYCLSLIVDDEKVIINYSTWDRTTRIGIYDKRYIDSITKYN